MSKTKLSIPPGFDTASKEQRIAYVQELWDRIAQDPENVPVPEHHKRILGERLEAYRTKPEAGQPWNEFRDKLLEKLQMNI